MHRNIEIEDSILRRTVKKSVGVGVVREVKDYFLCECLRLCER